MNAAIPLKERILAARAATPSLTRRQGRWLTAWLVALSVAVAVTIFELVGGLAHSRDRPLAVTVRLADGWTLASAALTWLIGRKTAMLMSFPRLLVAATLACPVVLFAWMGHFHGTYVEPPSAEDWPCFVCTLVIAAVPLASFLRMQRAVEPQYPDVLGAAAGAACGAWAGVIVLLWCPITSAWHTLMGHVVPISLMTVVGSILGAPDARCSTIACPDVFRKPRARSNVFPSGEPDERLLIGMSAIERAQLNVYFEGPNSPRWCGKTSIGELHMNRVWDCAMKLGMIAAHR